MLIFRKKKRSILVSSMRVIVFIIFLLIAFQSQAQTEVLFYEDTLGTLSYEDITTKEFKPLNGQILEKHNHSTYWFKVPADATDSKYRLTIYYDRYEDGDCYQNGRTIEKVRKQRYLSYRFSREHDVYLRMQPQFHAYFPIRLQEEAKFLEDESSNMLLNGFYYGFAILIVIYNISYYFVFKDKAFLYYALFLMSMSSGVFIMDGMLTYFGITGAWNNFIMIINYLFLAFFMSKFGEHYLFLNDYYPKLRKMNDHIGLTY